MTDKACAFCTKRLAITTGDLECRARPPVVDVGKYARFPVVRPADFCHDGFSLDGKAKEALKAKEAETLRLDGLVAETQARAEAEAAARAREPEAAQPDTAAPTKGRRARRARADAAQDKLL